MKPSALVLPLALAICCTGMSSATTLYWDGGASGVNTLSDNATTDSLNWLSGGNWDNGTTSAPLGSWIAGDSAIFGGSAVSQTIGAGTLTIGNMTFGAGGDGSGTSGTNYTITGGAITLSTDSVITTNTDTIISSSLTGAGSLTKQGNATLNLSNVSYAGATSISAGRLVLTNPASADGNGNGGFRTPSFALTSGATLEFALSSGWRAAKISGTTGTSFTGTGTLVKSGSATMYLGGSTADYASEVSLGSGSLIDIQGGKIQLDYAYNKTTWANNKADMNIASGAFFDLWDYGNTGANYVKIDALTGSGTITRGANTTTGGLEIGVDGGSGDFSGVIQDGGASRKINLIKSGSGTQTLSGANTYTGSTTIGGGTLTLAHANALSGSTFAGGAGNLVFGSSVASHAFVFGGLSGSKDLTLTDNATTPNAVALTIGGNNADNSYSGTLSGVSSLTKTGAGTQTLTNTISGSGGTVIVSNGTLKFSPTAQDKWGAGLNLSISSGATFEYTHSNRFSSGALNISGAGTFKYSGSSATYLANSTNYQAINLSAGGLLWVKSGTVSDFNIKTSNLGDLQIDSGATVQQPLGNEVNVNALNGGGTYKFSTTGNGYGLRVGVNNGNGSFSGVIQDTHATAAAPLTKVGSGTQVLSGTNTYRGITAVTGGKLVVSGSIGNSAVTVSNSGTVLASGLTGTIGSSVTINHGAILAAGDAGAAGTATVTGTTTLNNGSIFSWDISGDGASYDKLVSSGLAGEATAGDAIFRIVAADALFANAFWNQTRTWSDIFTTNGTSAISNWAELFSVAVVDGNFNPITPVNGSFAISGTSLTWSAVPEPTSALAGVLLGAGLLRRRRN